MNKKSHTLTSRKLSKHPCTPIIEVKNVSFGYTGREVLSHVSFSVNQGEMVGLIGPNGGGKTTLIKLLLRLLPLTKGHITLFGKDIASFHNWNNISYIPQKATFFDQQFPATVLEIAMLGRVPKAGLCTPLTRNDREKTIEALQLMGMQAFANEKIGNLSGGQQQRVLIAKAIAGKPDILIMDEPTTGVDANAEKRFYELLRTINKTTGLTLLIISHDIYTLSKYVENIECLNRTLRSCPAQLFKTKRDIEHLEETLFSHVH